MFDFLRRDAVDKDGDGDISKEEFVKNAMNSKFIHNMLKGHAKKKEIVQISLKNYNPQKDKCKCFSGTIIIKVETSQVRS